MKVENVTHNVTRLGVSEEQEFTIMNSAKAFKALSKTIYSDAILAVIRELSCNAKDAHVEAGKGDVPFEIHLPNALEPWFAVTDFGIGLSHEDVTGLYRTYFDSTKTDTNEATGQFGIGSKSPFAYVDSFTVEARWNGKMTIYSCFFNEKDIPTLAVMAEPFDTDQPNGLTIKMPVKENDMRNFARKAASQLRRFDPAPIVTGNTDYGVESIDYGVSGTNWKMLEGENPYGESKIHAIQGNVTYPVDKHSLGDLTSSQDAIMDLSADIFFDIGEIDMVLSREALEYTPKTIGNIKLALDQIGEEIPPLFQDKFNDCKTLWDARILFQGVIKNLPYGLRNLLADKDVGLKWHNQPLNEPFMLDIENFPLTIIQFQRGYRSNRGSALDAGYQNEHKFQASTDILFFYDDVGHGSHSRLTHYVENTNREDFKYAYLIKTDKKKDLKSYSKALGAVTIQPVSNLPKRPKAARAAMRVTSKVLLYKGKHHDRRDSWEPTELDLKTGGVYVMINRFKVYQGEYEVSNFDSTVAMAAEVGVIDVDTTPIYGIRKGDIAKMKDGSGWVNLYDLIKTSIKDLVIAEQIASVLANSLTFNNFSFDLDNHLTELRDAGFVAGTAMGDFLTAYDYMGEQGTTRATALANMAIRVNYQIAEALPEYDLEKLWEVVVAQYPLVDLIDTQKMRGGYYAKDGESKKNFAALMDYITAIDLTAADIEVEKAA